MDGLLSPLQKLRTRLAGAADQSLAPDMPLSSPQSDIAPVFIPTHHQERPMTETADQITIIGPGARFKGEIAFDGSGRILGAFDGTIRASGEVHIARGAVCRATIEAHTVVIDGRVEGDVLAHELLQLGNTAAVKGDVAAGGMIVAKGASFTGRCDVGPEALAAAGERFAAAQTGAADSISAPVHAAHPAEPKPASPRKQPRQVPDWVEQGAASSSDWLRPEPLPTVRVGGVTGAA